MGEGIGDGVITVIDKPGVSHTIFSLQTMMMRVRFYSSLREIIKKKAGRQSLPALESLTEDRRA
jgi:hypothetical protein